MNNDAAGIAPATDQTGTRSSVSDAETVKLLREYGVDYVQGFHIGADATEITSIAVDPAIAIKRS